MSGLVPTRTIALVRSPGTVANAIAEEKCGKASVVSVLARNFCGFALVWSCGGDRGAGGCAGRGWARANGGTRTLGCVWLDGGEYLWV